jgi:hypothetical protein
MTQTLLCSALALSFFGSSAYAFPKIPKADEMRANYNACERSDESWHRRWGQYAVAFDYDEAVKICREQSWYGMSDEAELMSCRVNGRWVWAGYFCRENWG